VGGEDRAALRERLWAGDFWSPTTQVWAAEAGGCVCGYLEVARLRPDTLRLERGEAPAGEPRQAALRTLAEYAFATFAGLGRLEAIVWPGDVAWRADLQAVGFRSEGTLRGYRLTDGRLGDVRCLCLCRADWC